MRFNCSIISTTKRARWPSGNRPNLALRDKDPVNLTDDASRIMPTSGGGFAQNDNTEARKQNGVIGSLSRKNLNPPSHPLAKGEGQWISEHPGVDIKESGIFPTKNSGALQMPHVPPPSFALQSWPIGSNTMGLPDLPHASLANVCPDDHSTISYFAVKCLRKGACSRKRKGFTRSRRRNTSSTTSII